MTAPRTTSAPRARRWRRAALGTVSTLVLVSTAGAAAAAYNYTTLQDNINVIDAGQALRQGGTTESGNRPVSAPGDSGPLTLLLMGSDTRAGANQKYGKVSVYGEAGRSDTTILLHLYAGRKKALAVSIPRDLEVDIPACDLKDGQSKPRRDRFNEAFSIGGPACSARTITTLTGVPIDHIMVVDFTGFKRVIDAIGGVPVCLTKAVDDKESKLVLPAGESVVSGEDALAFVRARKTLGDGSDLDRIKRQQQFLGSLIRQVRSAGVLLNPVKLLNTLNAITESLTVDKGLGSLAALRDLALSVRDLSAKDIRFVTAPWVVNPADPGNTLLLNTAKAAPLWSAIINDSPYPAPPSVGSDGRPLVTPPQDIRVRVLNGTGVTGKARDVADQLAAQGFTIAGVDTAPQTGVTTSVTYPPAYDESVRTVAFAVGAGTTTADGSGNVLTVTLGTDFTSVRTVVMPSAPKPTAKPTGASGQPAPTPTDDVAGTAADTTCSQG